jgi:hypothetical protein
MLQLWPEVEVALLFLRKDPNSGFVPNNSSGNKLFPFGQNSATKYPATASPQIVSNLLSANHMIVIKGVEIENG